MTKKPVRKKRVKGNMQSEHAKIVRKNMAKDNAMNRNMVRVNAVRENAVIENL